jgi:hypothetical protein
MRRVPLGRRMQLDELAILAKVLASPATSAITTDVEWSSGDGVRTAATFALEFALEPVRVKAASLPQGRELAGQEFRALLDRGGGQVPDGGS